LFGYGSSGPYVAGELALYVDWPGCWDADGIMEFCMFVHALLNGVQFPVTRP
jgi:hypothetical protein